MSYKEAYQFFKAKSDQLEKENKALLDALESMHKLVMEKRKSDSLPLSPILKSSPSKAQEHDSSSSKDSDATMSWSDLPLIEEDNFSDEAGFTFQTEEEAEEKQDDGLEEEDELLIAFRKMEEDIVARKARSARKAS